MVQRFGKPVPPAKNEAASIRNAINNSVVEPTRVDFISTGSTNWNLAISGKGVGGGWARGRVGNIVGDKSSGKTAEALETAFWFFNNILGFESSIFGKPKKLDITFANAETVMDFPLEHMFGPAFVDAVDWYIPDTVEQMGRHLTRKLHKEFDSETAYLYIIDTWDALGAETELEAFLESATKDKPIDGSYNVGKQKYASQHFFKHVCGLQTGKDFTIILVSQTRDKIGVVFGEKQYRGGGAALDFYCHQVVWIANHHPIVRSAEGEDREIGTHIKCIAKKNKVWKPRRTADAVIYLNYGIHDVSGLIDYCYGSMTAGSMKKELEFGNQKYTRIGLIKHIKDNNLHSTLASMAEEKWNRVEIKTAKILDDLEKRW